MPRRKSAAASKAETSAPTETRVTRRSLQAKSAVPEQPPAPVEEKPKRGKGAPSPATKKPAARGKKNEPKEENVETPVENKRGRARGRAAKTVEPVEEPVEEPEVAEEETVEEVETKPKGRSKARSRKSAATNVEAESPTVGRSRRARASQPTPEPKTSSRRSSRGAKKVEEKEEIQAEVEDEVVESVSTKRKREEEEDSHTEEVSTPKKAKIDSMENADKEESEAMDVDEPEPVNKSPIKIVVSKPVDDPQQESSMETEDVLAGNEHEKPDSPVKESPKVATPKITTPTKDTTPNIITTPTKEATPTKIVTPPTKEATPTKIVTPTKEATPTKIATPTKEATPTKIVTPTKEAISNNVVSPAKEATPTKVVTPTKEVTDAKVATPSKEDTPTKMDTPTKDVTSANISTPTKENAGVKAITPTKEVVSEVKKATSTPPTVTSPVKEASPKQETISATKDVTLSVEATATVSPVKQSAIPVQSTVQESSLVSPVKETNTAMKQSSPNEQKTVCEGKSEVSIAEKPLSEDFVLIEHKDVPDATSAEVLNAASKSNLQTKISEKSNDELMDTTPIDDCAASKIACPGTQAAIGAASAVAAIAVAGSAVAAPSAAVTASVQPIAPVSNGDSQLSSSTIVNNVSNNHVNTSALKADDLLNRTVVPNKFCLDVNRRSKPFTVVSYNILADCHAQKSGYKFIDSEHLSMAYRHELLMTELKYLNSDVLCLQEVGTSYYSTTLKPALAALGYEGHFYKRQADHMDEGEATFYRTCRFSLNQVFTYHLSELAKKDLASSNIPDDIRGYVSQFIEEPSVLLVTQLKCNDTQRLVTVANIHVCWEKFVKPDLQCIQVACAMRELVTLSQGPSNAHIIAGDFNSWPESPVYELMSVGYLNDKSVTALQAINNVILPNDEKKALINIWWKGFQHTSPSLRSSYKTILGHEPYTARSNSTGKIYQLDNIWYSSHCIGINNVLNTAHDQHLYAGIPTKDYPSDHLSLKAEFYLIANTGTQ